MRTMNLQLALAFMDYGKCGAWVGTWAMGLVVFFIIAFPILLATSQEDFDPTDVSFWECAGATFFGSLFWPVLLALGIIFSLLAGPTYLIYRTVKPVADKFS